MNELVEALVSCPTSVDGMQVYMSNLRTRSDVIVGAGTASQGQSTALLLMLETISFAECTSGCALLLSLQGDCLPDHAYFPYLVAAKRLLFEGTSSQLTYTQPEVTKVVRTMTEVALKNDQPRSVITALRRAIDLLSPSPTCLTAAHTLFLQACIKGQVYDVAVDFLRITTILEIDVKNAPLQSLDVVEFFYYAGVCYIAIADYTSALASFFQCMSVPAQALSSVVACAVKKARLVALIHYGRDLVTSMNLPGVVARYVKQPMGVYDNIATAFVRGDRAVLEAALVADESVLAQDGNTGLALRVVEALTRHRLKRLAATFLSLSLEDIARRAGIADAAAAERAVLRLVRTGDVTARINTTTGFVHFEEGSVASSSAACVSSGEGLLNAESAQLLEQCMRQTVELSQKLHAMQRAAVTSHKYLIKNTPTAAKGHISSAGEGMRGLGMPGMGMGMRMNNVGSIEALMDFDRDGMDLL